MEELFAGRDVDIDAMYQRMKGLMDGEGLDYGARTHTYNSRLAQEIGKWADSLDQDAEALHTGIYRAYFVEGRNIGDPAVLLDVVEKAGLPVDQATDVIENRTFQEAVDADWNLSRQYGVTGVPTFVAGGQGAVGAQPYEMLEGLLEAVGAQRK